MTFLSPDNGGTEGGVKTIEEPKGVFQKTQNENICLTYLNTEMNGNFHFLSFDIALQNDAKSASGQ